MNPFLTDSSLDPLWRAFSAALDRNGLGWRGRLLLPELTPEGRRRLGVLLDRPVRGDRRTISAADLADAVERLGDADLVTVLAELGHRPSGRREQAEARREQRVLRRAALDESSDDALGDGDWVSAWRESVGTDGLLSGIAPEDVPGLVADVAAVLARRDLSRTEVAALLFGDAHALDSSTLRARLVLRALRARNGPADERTAWERAGLPLDLVSAPVLTWNLPLRGETGPAVAARAMTAAGLPLHLSTAALRAAPPDVAAGTPVLVVENPRLVEAAAARRLDGAVLCTNGNPTTAPTEVIAALRAAGAELAYHGDVDTAGLAIAARAVAGGCVPLLMGASDYLDALRAARAAGVDLPHDDGAIPATPWDPGLAEVFAVHRAVVHEERVLDAVLTEFSRVVAHRREQG